MSGNRRSTTQQSNDRSASVARGVGSGSDRGDLDVVVAEQLDDALPFAVVVFDHQQALGRAAGEGLEPLERDLQLAGRRGFTR